MFKDTEKDETDLSEDYLTHRRDVYTLKQQGETTNETKI